MKRLNIIFLVGLVSGCTSMLTHVRFNDSEVIGQAGAMAKMMHCVETGNLSPDMAYRYGLASTQLLSVSVYDKALYEQTYKSVQNEAVQVLSSGAVTQQQFEAFCDELSQELPRLTGNVHRQYLNITQKRQADVTGMTQSLASKQNNSYHYNSPAAPLPSGQINFGQPLAGDSTKHYLVNTVDGQRQCFVTQSGYVNCL